VGFGAEKAATIRNEKGKLFSVHQVKEKITKMAVAFINLPVDSIVLPSSTLLNSDSPPFRFRQQTALGERFGELLGKNDVTVNIIERYMHE